ncbi:hydroxyectoine utilization dehydratase EutB [Qingshengfaniella alkalisoli]|uniref:Hydroxyectoine utilization dehydratase EutB n=1 Tax=Qingshengfaniella alkalisoli TaxID=2599296 RepID=A0A5B8J6N3_9RHOB|nr:hydroxyectoine utilization dehydratase EutB [Qingshengfaniella alkalisoli]QDY70097.1 hydroxyectoine utilization dehydratase EutB [Qingshengfaniella alkalisoli]
MTVTIADIQAARTRIDGTIRDTPCEQSSRLSEIVGAPVWLKMEHLQHTGAFKLRGAANTVLQLSDDERARGVTAASTGNHGRALAYAARQAGARCVICLSHLVPQNKADAVRALGAEVRIVGQSQDDAQEEVDRLVAEDGMIMVPPFDDPRVIAGQGTLGLEMLEQMPDLGTVAIGLSGGGLLGGIAVALKAQNPDIRVTGVCMERGAAMSDSLRAGHPVPCNELPTLADSLGGGIGLQNRHSFALVRDLIDDVILLTEAEIAAGIRHCYWQDRQIVEGAAAVGVAAVLAGKLTSEVPLGLLLSGGNIDMNLHHRIISGEDVNLTKEG